MGHEIATFVDKYQQPGEYSYRFNANDLSSGLYFVRLQSGGYIETKKNVLQK